MTEYQQATVITGNLVPYLNTVAKTGWRLVCVVNQYREGLADTSFTVIILQRETL